MKNEHKGRRGWKVLLIVLAAIAVIFGGFFTFMLAGKEATINLSLENVVLNSIPDGVYEGSYDGTRWSNTVDVTVKNHKITEIEVVKPQVFIQPETADALKQSVLANQRVDVDGVSGATADSKAYLKAVEQALKNAQVNP
jgi:uncharacterized protein with FMN-binding domain